MLCGNLPAIPQLPHLGIPSQPLLQCHFVKNGNLCSTWSFPNSLKQLHKNQARTEQAGTLSLPYIPWEALLRSQRQRTAWFELHSWTQVTHDFLKAHFPTEQPWAPAYCKWQQVFQCQRNQISLETWGIQGDSGVVLPLPSLLSVDAHSTALRAMTAKPSWSCGQCFIKTRNVWSQFQTTGCILNPLPSIWSCRGKSCSIVSKVFLTIKQDLGSIWLPSPLPISWEQ